jgi:hypothetical protein
VCALFRCLRSIAYYAAMSDQSNDRRRASHVIVWVMGVVVLVGGYLASFGPVHWLISRNYISSETHDRLCDTVYAPIVWVDMETDLLNDNPIGIAYYDYVEWFAP